jgi:hypothetical protein
VEQEEIGMSVNLQEGLVRELARVRDVVIPAYESIGAPGTLALALIRADVKFADDALAGGDAVEMVRAYHRLDAIEG